MNVSRTRAGPLFLTAVLFASLAAPSLAAQEQTEPGRVHGRVIDLDGERPLEGAVVRVATAGLEVMTDAAGRFTLNALAPGRHPLVVELAGYASRTDTLEIEAGTTLDVEIALSRAVVELPPIRVEARSRDLERLGFYDRRANEPGGYFVTADEIARRMPAYTSEILRRFPSVRIEYLGPGRRSVVFLRGVRCVPDVYLDGVKYPRGTADVDQVSPGSIAGIEVYIGALTPLQYRTNSCGAVLLWTKRGG